MITRGVSLCCGMWRPSACEMWGEDVVWMGDVIDVMRWHRGPKRRLWSPGTTAKQTQTKDSSVLEFPERKFNWLFYLFYNFFSVLGNTIYFRNCKDWSGLCKLVPVLPCMRYMIDQKWRWLTLFFWSSPINKWFALWTLDPPLNSEHLFKLALFNYLLGELARCFHLYNIKKQMMDNNLFYYKQIVVLQ